MARRGGTRNPNNYNNNNSNKGNGRNIQKKTSKKKSQSRLQDAFQIAEKQQNGDQSSSDNENDSDSNMKTRGGILNVRKKIEGSSLVSSSTRRNRNRDDNDDEDDFDDEEIDSDEALNSDDEYDVLNSKFSQTLRDRKKENNEFDEDDNEEEGYDSIDEADLIPLSEVWDRDDTDIQKSKKMGLNASNNDIILNDESENESENESESESDDYSDSESDLEDNDENPFDDLEEEDIEEDGNLENFVNKLTPKQLGRTKKKSLVNDKTEENLFGLSTSGKKLSIADMMKDIDDETNEEAILISKPRKEDEEEDDDEIDTNKAFNVPLPQRIQKRNERKAAYEIQKEEVDKWKDIVQTNRQSEVLKFNETKPNHNKPSSFKPIDKPINELDSKLDLLLEQSNIESKKTEDLFEDIETAKISKSDILKRTNELRLMRELMYRGQKDSKRLKKIKSKAYRQKLRKERQKNKDLIEGGSDAEVDEEDAEYQRAKERMSLKHKNTSKWAKSMIKSGMANDKQNRNEMEEMLKEGEKLRLKQLGKKENESSDDDRDLSDIENNNNEKEEEEDGNLERQKLGKGLMNMDFMKNAEKREKLQNLKDVEELRKFKESGNLLDKSEFEQEENGSNINLNQGRRVYTPSAAVAAEMANQVNKQVLNDLEDDEAKSLRNRLKEKPINKNNKPFQNHKPEKDSVEEEEVNPWLQENDDEDNKQQSGRKSNKIRVIDETSSKLDKAEAKITKKANNRNKKRSSSEAKLDDEDVVIDTSETLAIIDPLSQQRSEDYEGDATSSKDVKMFKQKDLIKEAFAGDDVTEEFEQEKKQVEDDEGDQEMDLTLQGWGSWSNNSSKKKKKIIKTVQGVVSKDKRKDKNKKNVIINEKVNKKNGKYQATAVPYPFETREQYERSLRMPLGQEWVSRESHQKLTMPRVIAKHGTVIDPLKKKK